MRHRHGGSKGPLYGAWCSMRARCNNPNEPAYPNYGGRGIKVCARWENFANFREDMGARPVGHTLERLDNDRGYEPVNCVWASRTRQSRNRRGLVQVTIDGETMPLSAWVERFGVVSYATAHARIASGWNPEDAVKTPNVARRKCKRRGERVATAEEMMVDGVPLADAIAASGLNHSTVMNRLRRGWDVHAALTLPPLKGRRNGKGAAENGVALDDAEAA